MLNDVYKKYYKYAFFSGFTTISTVRQPAEFFKNDIKPIFDYYRDSLKSIQQKAGIAEEMNKIVYQPVPYCLFGDFDLAVFSLTDDFGFATKEFKPSSNSSGFKYQVNTGIIPMIETYKEEHSTLKIFEDKMLPNFFSGKDFYPFTGIVMIKLNNAMLMGNGQGFISGIVFFLITFIDKEIERLDLEGHQLFYILNESLGWNEITINFFGNSMHQMQELLLSLRSKRLFDIIKFLREDLRQNSKYDQAKINSDIIPMLERVKTDSLLADLLKEKNGKDDDFLQSHPIIATSITYGFHAGLTSSDKDLDVIISERITNERFLEAFHKDYNAKVINIGWKVKPGHEVAADKLIKQCIGDRESEALLYENAQSGKYTFVYPERQVSVLEYILFARKAEVTFREGMFRNIIKFQSRIQWPSTVSYQDFDYSSHHDYIHGLFAIQKEFIEEVQDKLRIYPVSHTIKGQIENLIVNFNDAVSDPLMYSYFMGLKQSLLSFLKDKFLIGRSKEGDVRPGDTAFKDMIANISDFKKEAKPQDILLKDVNEADNILDFLQNWNKAYWNRYFHSYYFTEITDFNIEHHGGIQQILFTYDTMYKLVAKRIYGHQSKGPFVNVQGSPTITSTQYYNSINFNHLFRPAIYACECVHEAANHIIPFLVAQGQKEKYSFLLNPSRQIEDDMKMQFRTFERNIRLHLDARDEYENEYIEHNFGINTVRQIVTDYFTYRLAYEYPGGDNSDLILFAKNKEAAVRFCKCHWFLFLMNTDLYDRSADGEGAWFFKEEEFTEIFIRFNLMFFLFYKCSLADLEFLNDKCPSIELKPLWNYRKIMLLKFVIRLGEALKMEFDNMMETKDGRGFDLFHSDLKNIIVQGWNELEPKEKAIYNGITRTNFRLIETFYKLFNGGSDDKYNIIIRKSKSDYSDTQEKKGIHTNVDFFKKGGGRNIFLDPKGNIFSTSPGSRQEIFESYIYYIKEMWNFSLEISLLTFKGEISKRKTNNQEEDNYQK